MPDRIPWPVVGFLLGLLVLKPLQEWWDDRHNRRRRKQEQLRADLQRILNQPATPENIRRLFSERQPAPTAQAKLLLRVDQDDGADYETDKT